MNARLNVRIVPSHRQAEAHELKLRIDQWVGMNKSRIGQRYATALRDAPFALRYRCILLPRLLNAATGPLQRDHLAKQ